MAKYLIVGLGNIGEEYENTRHNIGFSVVEELADELGAKWESGKHANVAMAKHKGNILVIIKPTTYMNLSGKAVNYWLQSEKIKTDSLMVVVDELALPFGKIRIGPKGSDGGHNGLKDIQDVLKSTNYPRLRFGIGNEFSKGRQVNYVLGKWSEEEGASLKERIKIAADAIKSFVSVGLQRCMNEYNNK